MCPQPPPTMPKKFKRGTAQEKGKWIPKQTNKQEESYAK